MSVAPSIDLRWISCRDVASHVPFRSPPLYASIFISGSDHRLKTPLDRTSAAAGSAEWKVPLRLFLHPSSSADPVLHFEVRTEPGGIFGNRLAATAAVPFADLTPGSGEPRTATYQLAGPDGKPNGSITFSYAVNYPQPPPPPPPLPPPFYQPPVNAHHMPPIYQPSYRPTLPVPAPPPSLYPPVPPAQQWFPPAPYNPNYPRPPW